VKRTWGAVAMALTMGVTGCALRPVSAVTDAEPSTQSGVTCEYRLGGTPSKPVDPPDSAGVSSRGTLTVTLRMEAGTVTLTLDRAKAPCGVRSFENLALQNFFDNTLCHRLYDSGIFALQCGDPTGTGGGGPGYTFNDEFTSGQYLKGSVVEINQGPDTNGSQFLLVYGDSPIQGNYTILGTMDAASTNVIGSIAEEGQDGSYAGTGGGGVPNGPAGITDVVLG
jgi:peptidyl-prolyl cis-trans isomerase B (cyclophilin B)